MAIAIAQAIMDAYAGAWAKVTTCVGGEMETAEELRVFFRKIEAEGKDAARSATYEQLTDALEIASAEIDRMFVFKGAKVTPDQELAWPRIGVEGAPHDKVPRCVMDATSFLGGAYLAGYRIGSDDLDLSKGLVSCLFLLLDPVIDADASVLSTRASH